MTFGRARKLFLESAGAVLMELRWNILQEGTSRMIFLTHGACPSMWEEWAALALS